MTSTDAKPMTTAQVEEWVDAEHWNPNPRKDGAILVDPDQLLATTRALDEARNDLNELCDILRSPTSRAAVASARDLVRRWEELGLRAEKAERKLDEYVAATRAAAGIGAHAAHEMVLVLIRGLALACEEWKRVALRDESGLSGITWKQCYEQAVEALEKAELEVSRMRNEQRKGAEAVIAAQLVERAARAKAAEWKAMADAAQADVERLVGEKAELVAALEGVLSVVGERMVLRFPDELQTARAALTKAKSPRFVDVAESNRSAINENPDVAEAFRAEASALAKAKGGG